MDHQSIQILSYFGVTVHMYHAIMYISALLNPETSLRLAGNSGAEAGRVQPARCSHDDFPVDYAMLRKVIYVALQPDEGFFVNGFGTVV